jgi:hypothetical protein
LERYLENCCLEFCYNTLKSLSILRFLTGALTSSQISSVSAPKVTGSLVDDQISSVSAAKVTGSLVDDQISSVSAAKVTGSLVDGQISSVSAAKVTGSLVDDQISSISSSKITGTDFSTQSNALQYKYLTHANLDKFCQMFDDTLSIPKVDCLSLFNDFGLDVTGSTGEYTSCCSNA